MLVGLESGAINLWVADETVTNWSLVAFLPEYYMHTLAVKRIKFSLTESDVNKGKYTVASCGSDHTVRIFSFNLSF